MSALKKATQTKLSTPLPLDQKHPNHLNNPKRTDGNDRGYAGKRFRGIG